MALIAVATYQAKHELVLLLLLPLFNSKVALLLSLLPLFNLKVGSAGAIVAIVLVAIVQS